MLTTSAIIELIDTEISYRAGANFVEEYQEANTNRFRGCSMDQLMKWREYYANKLAVENGTTGSPSFHLAEPFAV